MAAMFGDSGLPGGFHNDVLQAQPADRDAKRSLADECKQRAKGSLGNKNYPEAITLYAKAIEVMDGEGQNDYVAILHANTSMCQLGMDKAADAAVSAEKAIELDPAYVKGYYRAGAAYQKLKKFDDAKTALLKGLEKKPDDKDMVKMMDTVQKAIVNGESKPASKPVAKSTTTTTTTTTTTSPPKSGKAGTAKQASNLVVDKDNEGVIRGYKKTSDGRTTSYFNHELDEATKELIGDITPQAISSSAAASTEAAAPSGAGVSAWNSAGTFESKQMTPWAKQRITELVKAVHVVGADDGVSVTVKSVELEGDAEIVSARGKRKVIYDFTATLTWELSFGDDDTATGTLKVLDIEADEGEYEVGEITVSGSTTKEGKDMIRKYIRAGSAGLQKAAFAAFDQFRGEIKAK